MSKKKTEKAPPAVDLDGAPEDEFDVAGDVQTEAKAPAPADEKAPAINFACVAEKSRAALLKRRARELDKSPYVRGLKKRISELERRLAERGDAPRADG